MKEKTSFKKSEELEKYLARVSAEQFLKGSIALRGGWDGQVARKGTFFRFVISGRGGCTKRRIKQIQLINPGAAAVAVVVAAAAAAAALLAAVRWRLPLSRNARARDPR